jgi:(1->4)-alpha-D-glucan 1-alpha-D-glucosylmutase
MLASSTHDTKRSEDVRARIALLSEGPSVFVERVVEPLAARHEPPDRNLAWFVFQTLVGAHPLPLDRAMAYVEKATKEAKQRTSWTEPDPAYDAAVRAWLEALYADEECTGRVATFATAIEDPGWSNALGAQLVKLTAPGVPDVYQGTELWDLSLVDPDNRRPVDYELRRQLLAELDHLSPAEVWARRDEGLPKLLVTRDALRARVDGDYQPLVARGPMAEHVLAFARGGKYATVVTRLPLGLRRKGGLWDGETTVELPWGEVLVADILRDLPVALLERP